MAEFHRITMEPVSMTNLNQSISNSCWSTNDSTPWLATSIDRVIETSLTIITELSSIVSHRPTITTMDDSTVSSALTINSNDYSAFERHEWESLKSIIWPSLASINMYLSSAITNVQPPTINDHDWSSRDHRLINNHQ